MDDIKYIVEYINLQTSWCSGCHFVKALTKFCYDEIFFKEPNSLLWLFHMIATGYPKI